MSATLSRRSRRSLLGLMAAAGTVASFAPGGILKPTSAAEPRVVSIGGAVTEIVYALGAEDRLAAVDSTSLYPAGAQDLPDVGYMRQLAAEPILALNPSLVLAVADAGPPPVFEQLRAAGVRIITVPDTPSPEGVIEKIQAVGRALNLEQRANALAKDIEDSFAKTRTQIAGLEAQPSVLFLLSIGRGAPLAAGRGTSAARMIDLAGGRNAANAFEGFKPLSPEAAVAAEPEVILVTRETLEQLGGKAKLLARPELATTPAGRNKRLAAMDGLLLLGFGPRTPEAVRKLARKLHPDADLSFVNE